MPDAAAAAPRHHQDGRSSGAAPACGCCAWSAASRSSSAAWRKFRPGALIVAAKHQSTWETFALLGCSTTPTFILKRELMWIPLFGWCIVEGRHDPGRSRRRLAGADDMTTRAREGDPQRPPAHHLSGRHAPAGRRRAALQVRRRAPLCRDRRALRAGRAQFGPVLAAPLVPAAARHDRGRVPRADPAGARQAGVLRSGCRTTSRPRPRGSSPKARAPKLKRLGIDWRADMCVVRALEPLRQQMQIVHRGSPALPARRRSRSHSRGCCRSGRGPGARWCSCCSSVSRPAYCGWLRSTV